MKRVVITGAGTINALGLSVPETLAAMREGKCGIGPLEFRDVERLAIRIGGQVRGFEAEGRYNRQQIALYDRFTQFTLTAAREAIEQSGLTFTDELAARAGVVLGTAGGGVSTWDDNYRAVYEEGKNRVHPFVVPKLMNNAAASHVSMEWNLRGPSFTVSTACASSNHAMAQAFAMVRSGMSPVMVTGGSESMLCFGGVKAWEGLRVMSRDACRPFSANRNGMVQGEGAGVFVFEDYEHARARGAEILCEVAGFAMTSDASDIVMPSKAGAARAMQGALADATATDLGATAVKAAVDRSGVPVDKFDRTYMGCVLPAGLGQAPARQASIKAGLPKSVQATTVNKVCGSGMQTVIMGSEALASGTVNYVVAGGMESMTNAPYLLKKHRSGARLGHDTAYDHMFLDGLEDLSLIHISEPTRPY